MTSDRRPRIFLSYSHKDAKYRTELSTHLKVLEREFGVYAWTDESIRGGDAWRKAIDDGLAGAEIVVLLVSAHALSSDFNLDQEVAGHIRAAKRVYPVLVRDCAWDAVPWLSPKQMRPRGALPERRLKALSKMRPADRDAALAEIAREIRALLSPRTRTATV